MNRISNPNASSMIAANPNAVASRQTISSKDDASIASGSSGCGSLTKKKSAGLEYQQALDVDPQSIVSSIITDSGISETSETPLMSLFNSNIAPVSSSQNLSAQQQNAGELGHSRNSSNTSQVSSQVRSVGIDYTMNSLLDVEGIWLQQLLRPTALSPKFRR
jgi:hypothetical protein